MSKARTPTDEQRAAIEARGNLCLSAGAGSGKTFVLKERYLALLDRHPDWPVESVVALTFTNKAAAEMRARIAEGLAERISAEGDGARAQRYRVIAERLHAAPIGTIHAFLGAQLRYYWAEAGIDPDFRTLDDAEAGTLLREAIASVLEVRFARPDNAMARDTAVLAGMTSASGLRGMLEQAVKERALTADILEHLTRTPFDELAAKLDKRKKEEFRNLDFQMLASEVRNVTGLAPNGELNRLADLLETVANLTEVNDETAGPLIQRAADERATVFLKQMNCRLGISVRRALNSSQALDLLEESIGPMLEVFGSALPGVLREDRENLMLAIAFAHLAKDVFAAYDAVKQGVGGEALDFNDLELRFIGLIRERADVLDDLRSRFRTFMVDEFQDTSPAHWEIIRRLTKDPRTDQPGAERLFIVGDAKQSIYAFRNADVGLFRDAQKWIRGSCGDGEPGVLKLTRNFRSVPPLLRFFNGVFSRLFSAEGGLGGAIPYENSEAGQADTGETGPAVRVVKLCPDGNLVGDARAAEAVWIAEEIARRHGETGDAHVPYGDWAVIYRKKARFAYLEAELQHRGIPFVSLRGGGFFAAEEVAAVLAWMEVSCNPQDDLAVATVLRGPFLNFTDELLLKLALREAPSWRERVRSAAANGAGLTAWELPLVVRAERLLAALHAQATVLPLPEWLEFLYQRIGARAIGQAGPRALQARENLEQLLRLAEGQRGQTFPEFLEWAAEQEGAGDGASEAVLEGADNAVKLLTVHKSKGLEFPRVILPGLADSEEGMRDKLAHDRKEWLVFHGTLASTTEKSFLQLNIERENKRREQEESVRVLYVAMTRAEKHLTLVLRERPSHKESWQELLEPELRQVAALGLVERLEEMQSEGASVEVGPEDSDEPAPPVPAGWEPFAPEWEAELCARRAAAGRLLEASGRAAGAAAPLALFGPPGRRLEVRERPVPVTTLLSFVEAQESAEGAAAAPWAPADPAREVPSTVRGTLLHEALRLHLRGTGRDALRARIERMLVRQAPALDVEARAALAESWQGLIEGAARGGALALFDGAADVRFEEQFVLRLPSGLVTAKFDALVRTAAGELVVADFKFDRHIGEARAARYARQIRWYLLMAARLSPGQAAWRGQMIHVPEGAAELKEQVIGAGDLEALTDEVDGWLRRFRSLPAGPSIDAAAAGGGERESAFLALDSASGASSP